MATYKELVEQIEKLQMEADLAREREVDGVIAEIKSKIAEYGLTAKDLGFSSGEQVKIKTKPPTPAKYRNPEGLEWSGRGREPLWLKEALNSGKSKDDFLI